VQLDKHAVGTPALRTQNRKRDIALGLHKNEGTWESGTSWLLVYHDDQGAVAEPKRIKELQY
jgi:hypothetical protein